jgi:hypothetical protein
MIVSSRYQEYGKPLINPTQLGNAYNNIKKTEINFVYAQVYNKGTIKTKDPKALLNEAVQIA